MQPAPSVGVDGPTTKFACCPPSEHMAPVTQLHATGTVLLWLPALNTTHSIAFAVLTESKPAGIHAKNLTRKTYSHPSTGRSRKGYLDAPFLALL